MAPQTDEKAAAVLSVLARATSVEYQTYMRSAEMPSEGEKEAFLNDFVTLSFDRLDQMLPVMERWIKDIGGSGEVAKKLMAYLSDPDPAVRNATAYSLGQMSYQPAIPELLCLLKDPHLWVRDATVLSLGLFADEALHPLSLAMERETSSFKILALDVLGRIKGAWSKALIEKYLNDPDRNVSRAAKQGLAGF